MSEDHEDQRAAIVGVVLFVVLVVLLIIVGWILRVFLVEYA